MRDKVKKLQRYIRRFIMLRKAAHIRHTVAKENLKAALGLVCVHLRLVCVHLRLVFGEGEPEGRPCT